MTDPWEEYEQWRAKYIDVEPAQLTDIEARRELNECLDEYAKNKRALFLPGFCDFVIRQGFGAASPVRTNGRPESWQTTGRRLWGAKHFDEEMKKAIERSRAAKTSGRISRESSPS